MPELGKRGRFATVSHRDVFYTMFLSKKNGVILLKYQDV